MDARIAIIIAPFLNSTNMKNSPYEKSIFLFSAIALIAIFAYLQPDIFWLRVTPMNGDLWSIKDPTVSWAAFMPSFREFRYELLNHANVLWSNLRGMGQPMLGNGVQGAPLFPLSLALIGVPDAYFWTIMPMARIMLIGLMLFLTARNIFKLPFAAALTFAILAGYNVNVFRWINHPWTNGILAGAWYFYFLVRVTFPEQASKRRRQCQAIGLVIGIIGMVTNGFPEASALYAIIILAGFMAIAIAKFGDLRDHFFETTKTLFLLHIVGFGFASIQIVALLEYIDYTGVMNLRKGYVSGTWTAKDAEPYTLSQLTVFWKTEAQRRYLSFTVGVIGGYLALQGILCLILDRARIGKVGTWTGVGFALTMLLFGVKGFGLSESVEWVFSKTPVLDVSHFPLYFSPLFYIGSAYFAALGLSTYFHKPSESRSYHFARSLWALASFVVMIRTIEASVALFSNKSPREFWINQLHGESFTFLWFLLPIAGGLIAFHAIYALNFKPLKQLAPYRLVAVIGSLLVMSGVILEQRHVVKGRYAPTNDKVLFRSSEQLEMLNESIASSGLRRHELRTRDQTGDYVHHGIATLDNGASAMLPGELRLLRIMLYDAPYGGYLALKDQRHLWSGWLMSNNLTLVHSTPYSIPDWTDYQESASLDVSRHKKETAYKLKQQNPYYFFGFAESFSTPNLTKIWLKLSHGNAETRWLEANIGHQSAKDLSGKIRTKSLWRAKLPFDQLDGDKNYQLTVRVVNEVSKQYQDLPELPLYVEGSSSERPAFTSYRGVKLAENDNGSRSIYLEKQALPRAFVASQCIDGMENNDVILEMKRGSSMLNGLVTLSNDSQGVCDSYSREMKAVEIRSDTGSKLSFAAIQGPALLYVNDSYYPGWKAIDANSLETFTIRRANVGMRAVFLPEQKTYDLRMVYRPTWLWPVVAIKMASLLILIWALKTLRARNRRQKLAWETSHQRPRPA